MPPTLSWWYIRSSSSLSSHCRRAGGRQAGRCQGKRCRMGSRGQHGHAAARGSRGHRGHVVHSPASSQPAQGPHLDCALGEGRQDQVWLPIHCALLGVANHVSLEHAAGGAGVAQGAGAALRQSWQGEGSGSSRTTRAAGPRFVWARSSSRQQRRAGSWCLLRDDGRVVVEQHVELSHAQELHGGADALHCGSQPGGRWRARGARVSGPGQLGGRLGGQRAGRHHRGARWAGNPAPSQGLCCRRRRRVDASSNGSSTLIAIPSPHLWR